MIARAIERRDDPMSTAFVGRWKQDTEKEFKHPTTSLFVVFLDRQKSYRAKKVA
jgi:hypothetical protein